jgi:integrase
MPERYRALVFLAAFGSLRWGELAALRRCDVDVEHGTVRVERSLTELAGGGYLFGLPKSAAGKRVVVVPAVIRPALAEAQASRCKASSLPLLLSPTRHSSLGYEQSEAGIRRLGRSPVRAPACADVLGPCLVKRPVSGLAACREVSRAQIRALGGRSQLLGVTRWIEASVWGTGRRRCEGFRR